MKHAPLLTIVLTIIYFQCFTAKTNESTLQRYIFDFMATRSTDDINFALSLIPVITSKSERNGIDPLLTAFIIAQESSFRPHVEGDHKDYGLMQVVKGGVCARGQDLSTPDGQIKAGVECLALARDSCNGSLKQTLTMYASGRCVSDSVRTQRKINYRIFKYEKTKEKYNE